MFYFGQRTAAHKALVQREGKNYPTISQFMRTRQFSGVFFSGYEVKFSTWH